VYPVGSHHSQGRRKETAGRYLGRKRKAATEVLHHVFPIYDTLPDHLEYKALMKQASFLVDNTCVPMVQCYRDHCKANQEAFAEKWQYLSYWSRLTSTYCDGTGEECLSSTMKKMEKIFTSLVRSQFC
jgi:hypothetical protein